AAASQPILIQVAQESAMKDMASRLEAMSERLMSDPEIRRSAEQMQERLMADPETRQLLEELMRRLGGGNPPPEELNSAAVFGGAAGVALTRLAGAFHSANRPGCHRSISVWSRDAAVVWLPRAWCGTGRRHDVTRLRT